MICPKCQSNNPESAKFCVKCGVPLSPSGPKYKCSHCNGVFQGHVNFCPNCGATMNWPGEENTVQNQNGPVTPNANFKPKGKINGVGVIAEPIDESKEGKLFSLLTRIAAIATYVFVVVAGIVGYLTISGNGQNPSDLLLGNAPFTETGFIYQNGGQSWPTLLWFLGNALSGYAQVFTVLALLALVGTAVPCLILGLITCVKGLTKKTNSFPYTTLGFSLAGALLSFAIMAMYYSNSATAVEYSTKAQSIGSYDIGVGGIIVVVFAVIMIALLTLKGVFASKANNNKKSLVGSILSGVASLFAVIGIVLVADSKITVAAQQMNGYSTGAYEVISYSRGTLLEALLNSPKFNSVEGFVESCSGYIVASIVFVIIACAFVGLFFNESFKSACSVTGKSVKQIIFAAAAMVAMIIGVVLFDVMITNNMVSAANAGYAFDYCYGGYPYSIGSTNGGVAGIAMFVIALIVSVVSFIFKKKGFDQVKSNDPAPSINNIVAPTQNITEEEDDE